MSVIQSVWCIGSARFVKEISPLIEQYARVRWIADDAMLGRVLATSRCDTVIAEHSAECSSVDRLQQVRLLLPRTRRLVVLPGVDLKSVRAYLDTNAATEVIYRPLEPATVLHACGLKPVKPARMLSPA